MSELFRSKFNRRGVLKSSMAVAAGGLLSRYSLEKAAAQAEPAIKNVNTNSNPSTLKITDMRYAIIVKPGPSPCPIIRIDTKTVRAAGRSTQGVKLLNLEEDDKVAAAVVIPPEEAKVELEDGTLLQ